MRRTFGWRPAASGSWVALCATVCAVLATPAASAQPPPPPSTRTASVGAEPQHAGAAGRLLGAAEHPGELRPGARAGDLHLQRRDGLRRVGAVPGRRQRLGRRPADRAGADDADPDGAGRRPRADRSSRQIGADRRRSTVTAHYADGPTRERDRRQHRDAVRHQQSGDCDDHGQRPGHRRWRAAPCWSRRRNEGTSGFTSVRVVLTADSDGDGIAGRPRARARAQSEQRRRRARGSRPRRAVESRREPAPAPICATRTATATASSTARKPRPAPTGSSPTRCSADTDGDGVRDGLEVASGSDPTNAGSINLGQALKALIGVRRRPSRSRSTACMGEGFAAADRHRAAAGRHDDRSRRRRSAAPTTRRATSTSATSARRMAGCSAPANGPCTITVTNSGFTAHRARARSRTSRRWRSGRSRSPATPTTSTPTAASRTSRPAPPACRSSTWRTRRRRSSSRRSTRRATPTTCACVGNLVYIADGCGRPADHRRDEPAGAGRCLASLDTPGEANDVHRLRQLGLHRRRLVRRPDHRRLESCRRRHCSCGRSTRRARRAAWTSRARRSWWPMTVRRRACASSTSRIRRPPAIVGNVSLAGDGHRRRLWRTASRSSLPTPAACTSSTCATPAAPGCWLRTFPGIAPERLRAARRPGGRPVRAVRRAAVCRRGRADRRHQQPGHAVLPRRPQLRARTTPAPASR